MSSSKAGNLRAKPTDLNKVSSENIWQQIYVLYILNIYYVVLNSILYIILHNNVYAYNQSLKTFGEGFVLESLDNLRTR